ncbi:hypothetical protein BH23BAC2_BH23BAC2_19750 [soil metagenome]
MIAYILQVILFQLLFLLVYEILLKKETFFSYNRWYLLATSVISLLLPLVKIGALAFLIPAEALPGIATVWLPEVFIGEAPAATQTSGATEVAGELIKINWWLVAYGTGVIASLIIFFRKYQNLSRLFRFRAIASEKDLRIIEIPNSTLACTFYKTIFLGDQLTEAERQQILSHELVHVKEKHSLDLVYFELYRIIFWFNPLIYIYQSRIATLHEFIADAVVVKSTEKRSYYDQLLNSAFNTTNISFINQFFNHSLIKKRIVMLQKSRSKTIAKLKFLILLPLMLLMLTYVACSEDKAPQDEQISKIQENALFIEIKDFGNQTAEEKETIARSIEEMKTTAGYDQVHITDGKKTLIMSNNPKTGKPEIIIENLHGDIIEERRINPNYKSADVPFAVVEHVPVYPGCENLSSNEERKKCMSENVQKFVTTNFDTSLGEKLGLTGLNRVIAVFKISPEGNITDVRARAPHPDLEVEAKRVIEGLPKMTPGEQKGQKVGVSYSIPIVFKVGEE